MEKIRIICIDNTNYPVSLEVNKEYEGVDCGISYMIVDENYESYEYPKELFVRI